MSSRYYLAKNCGRVLFIMMLLGGEIFAQSNSINIRTTPFTKDGEPFEDENRLRSILDLTIGEIDIFSLVDRDKIASSLDASNTEKNIREDHNQEIEEDFHISSADYIVYGDVIRPYSSKDFKVYLQFVKLLDDKVTQRLPFYFVILHEDMFDDNKLREVFHLELQKFVDTYFLLSGDTLTNFNSPKIFEHLKNQDSLIFNLKNELEHTQQELNNLEEQNQYIQSIHITLLVVFDSINSENIRTNIINSEELTGLLSPGETMDYSLKLNETFIAFASNKIITKNLYPNILSFQTTFSNYKYSLLNRKLNFLQEMKSLVVDFRNHPLPRRPDSIRLNIAINSKNVIENQPIGQDKFIFNEKNQILILINEILEEAIKNY